MGKLKGTRRCFGNKFHRKIESLGFNAIVFYFAPSELVFIWAFCLAPKALPWAAIFHPVGVKNEICAEIVHYFGVFLQIAETVPRC